MSKSLPDHGGADFNALASRQRPGLVSELWGFAMHTRKWWLLPLILVFLGIGAIIMLGGTAAAPFIYTLF